jgi:hypothetical protein
VKNRSGKGEVTKEKRRVKEANSGKYGSHT